MAVEHEQLIECIDTLRDEVRVLRIAIDELREEIQHLVRNPDRFAGLAPTNTSVGGGCENERRLAGQKFGELLAMPLSSHSVVIPPGQAQRKSIPKKDV